MLCVALAGGIALLCALARLVTLHVTCLQLNPRDLQCSVRNHSSAQELYSHLQLLGGNQNCSSILPKSLPYPRC